MAKRQLAAQTATSLFAGLLAFSTGFSAPAVAQSAADEDPGWYFGLNGGYGSLSDTENEVITPGAPGETTDPLILTILPDILGICDTPLSLLCFQDETPGGTTTRVSFESTYEDGAVYGGQLGYVFSNGFRPELGFGYRSNKFDTVSTGADGASNQAEGKLETTSLNANLWYDFFSVRDKVRPYLGAGFGASQVSIKDFSQNGATTASLSDKQSVFSYQLGAGVGFRMGDRTRLSLDYRYLVANESEFDTGGGSTLTTDYKHSSFQLGLNFFLGKGFGAADADGDGVPDDQDKCPDSPAGVAVGPDGCPLDSDGDGVPDHQDKCPGTPKGVSVGADGCPLDSDGDGVPDSLDKCPGTKPGMQVGADGCPLDADGDGVADSLDRCPGSPAGVAVGPDGCPLDSDNDGVPDNLDKCPGTPAGAIVDANGCEPDGDGDGVPDRLDRCPDTPPGEKVGPSGCPNDSDGDGVPDDIDECPNTPPGAKVLANGCALKGDCRTPRPGEEVDENGCAVDQTFILRGVNFEFDSDRLTPEAKEILKQVAQTLQAYPDVNVEIAGHTDSTGTDAYNLGLSEKRSIAVKNFLTGQGVLAARMSPTGYGESQPIDTNDTEEGQAKNRRVELRVIEEDKNLGQ